MVVLPGGSGGYLRERQLEIRVSAEGPTCVLTVADLQVHRSKFSCVLGNFCLAFSKIISSLAELALRP